MKEKQVIEPAIIIDDEVLESDVTENVVRVTPESLHVLKDDPKSLRSSFQRGTFPLNACKLQQGEFVLETPVRARK